MVALVFWSDAFVLTFYSKVVLFSEIHVMISVGPLTVSDTVFYMRYIALITDKELYSILFLDLQAAFILQNMILYVPCIVINFLIFCK